MKAELATRARIGGAKTVGEYLARLLATGIGAGLDVVRCTNPYDGAYRGAWFGGFDSAVAAFHTDPGPEATFPERMERERWAALRAGRQAMRRPRLA